MPPITRIFLRLETMHTSGASTDGDVYLGVCGREFSLDTSDDNFQGGNEEFIFGEPGANVRFREWNDPRHPQLDRDNIDRFPVYIRFNPKERDDNWHLRQAAMFINGDEEAPWDTGDVIPTTVGIVLGIHAGLRVDIPKANNVLTQQQINDSVQAYRPDDATGRT